LIVETLWPRRLRIDEREQCECAGDRHRDAANEPLRSLRDSLGRRDQVWSRLAVPVDALVEEDRMKLRRTVFAVAAATAVTAGIAGSGGAAPAGSSIGAIAAMFSVNPLTGGQVPPRLYKWVNDDVSIFVQLDRPNPAEAKTVRYVGVSVKGTFCAETQPGGAKGPFTHFHRLDAPVYAQGHGGPPGTQGYWLMWVATDEFESFDRRQIKPGVDYGFSPTPAPSCGASPKPSFQGPGAHVLTRPERTQLAGFFHDNPFLGGQVAPRQYRWMSADTLVFLQFDKPDAAKASRLRYIGVSTRGTFCDSGRPSADFTHFDRLRAKSYAKAAGGKPGQGGFWSLFVRVDDSGGATPGLEGKVAPTPPPSCPKA
jgi:hypothetical protein